MTTDHRAAVITKAQELFWDAWLSGADTAKAVELIVGCTWDAAWATAAQYAHETAGGDCE